MLALRPQSTPTRASATGPDFGLGVQGRVNDALERLLIRLNRSRFAVSDKRSMTTVAANDAIKIFRQMIEETAEHLQGHQDIHVDSVLKAVENIGKNFHRAPAFRLLLANITRRVMALVREAAQMKEGQGMMRVASRLTAIDVWVEDSHHPDDAECIDGGHETMLSMAKAFRGKAYNVHNPCDFFDAIIDGLDEFETEVSAMTENVAMRAPDHIYNGEVIVMYGCSHTVLAFLAKAAEQRSFRVVVLDVDVDSPAASRLKSRLGANVDVSVLPDSSMLAAMQGASKVLVSTEAILANGGLLAPTGSMLLALCAQQCSVPVVVVATTIKISPYYPVDGLCTSLVKMSRSAAKDVRWSTFAQPAKVLPGSQMHSSCDELLQPQVFNPVMEYVPPELIRMYITNEGEFTAPSVFRYLREQYHEDDTHI